MTWSIFFNIKILWFVEMTQEPNSWLDQESYWSYFFPFRLYLSALWIFFMQDRKALAEVTMSVLSSLHQGFHPERRKYGFGVHTTLRKNACLHCFSKPLWFQCFSLINAYGRAPIIVEEKKNHELWYLTGLDLTPDSADSHTNYMYQDTGTSTLYFLICKMETIMPTF